jgi:ActR/RegA family two-component response regulator
MPRATETELFVVDDDPLYTHILVLDLNRNGLPEPRVFRTKPEAEAAINSLPPDTPLCIILDRDLEDDPNFSDYGGVHVLNLIRDKHAGATVVAHATNVEIFREMGVNAAFPKNERPDLIEFLKNFYTT